MRAREFIREQVASLAAPVVAPALAPIKQAVGNVTKDFVKGATTKMPSVQTAMKQAGTTPGKAGVVADKANDAWGYTQAGDTFAQDQLTQNLIGRSIQGVAKSVTPDKAALRAAADSPIKNTLIKAAPRTLGAIGTAVRTGTGLAPTLMLHSPETGPKNVPRTGPWKGMELNPIPNPKTGVREPFTASDIEAYNQLYPQGWKPEYDEKGKEVQKRYDKDNPIRTAIRNKTSIELPFGDSDVEVFNNPKYNPDKHDPKVTNDPLRDPNATLIKK